MRPRLLCGDNCQRDIGEVLALDQYAYFARLLDTIDIAFCLFDGRERLLIWNHSYIAFFPEHADMVRSGQSYRDALNRFYEKTLLPGEADLRPLKVEEALDRFRRQTRPYLLSHNGRRLQITTLPTIDGGRIRLWREVSRGTAGSAIELGWSGFPIDLLDHMADGAMVLDQHDRIIASNQEFRLLYDVPAERSVIGARFGEIVRDAWSAADEAGMPPLGDLDRVRFAQEPFEVELPGARWRRVMVRRQANGISYFSHSDITVLKRQQRDLQLAERRAREEEYRYRLLAENANDIIVATSSDLVIEFASPAARRVLGWAPDAMLGRPLTDFIHSDNHQAFLDPSPDGAAGPRGNATVMCRMRDEGGEWVWMEVSIGRLDGNADIAMVCSFRDVTERVEAEQALKLAHDELSSIAATDGLTNLANRRRFDAVYDQEWRRAQRERHALSLMLIDVDHFKAVNDGYGHVVGDECLRRIAALIGGCVHRPADLVARYGGEEFAVLLPQTPLSGAVALADRIRETVATADWKMVDPGLPAITVSVGICAVTVTEGYSSTQALRMADEALYRAKNAGRDRCEARMLG